MDLSRYFDCNATAPMHPAAEEMLLRAQDRYWYNASGLYREGAAPKHALNEARETCAQFLECEPEEIIFTSGATESNNTVFYLTSRHADARLLISALEHPSAAEPAAHWFEGRRKYFDLLPTGVADMESLHGTAEEFRPTLISLMAANNETGVLQPWREALATARRIGALFHCDGTQWIGKKPSGGLGQCDFLTGSAHKFGGPKGVGFLKAPAKVKGSYLKGGPQEDGRRAGTENVPGILAMVAAWEAREKEVESVLSSGLMAKTVFETSLSLTIPGTVVVGAESPRLWNTCLAIMPEFPNTRWLARLSDLQFCVSTGSACSRGQGASEVLAAMGIDAALLNRVLRFSATWGATTEDWMRLAVALTVVHSDLKQGTQRPRTSMPI